MANLNKNSSVTFSVGGIVMLVSGLIIVILGYANLMAEIEAAKKLPAPAITTERFEYNLKIVKDDVQDIKESLQNLEERIYQMRDDK